MKKIILLLLLSFIYVSSFSQDKQAYIEEFAESTYSKQVDTDDINSLKEGEYVIGYEEGDMKIDIITKTDIVILSDVHDWNVNSRALQKFAKNLEKKAIILYIIDDNINKNHPAFRIPYRRNNIEMYTIDSKYDIIKIQPSDDV